MDSDFIFILSVLYLRSSVDSFALAAWAEIGGAIALHDALHFGCAKAARLAGAVIDAPMIFVRATVITAFDILRVNIHGRTMRDGLAEYADNRTVQTPHATLWHIGGDGLRMKAREKKGFGGVDIA